MDLKEKAKALNIDVTEFENDEDLQKAITEAETKNKPDNEEKNKTEREKYLDDEMKKAIKKRDEAKEEARQLKKKIDDLEKNTKDLPSVEELKSLKEELKELKEYKENIDKEIEEKELAKKSEIERAAILQKKEFDKIQKSLQDQIDAFNKRLEEKDTDIKKRDERIKALRNTSLEADIMTFSSAGDIKAINPRQIVRLLKEDFEYDDNLDKYYYPIYNDKGKLVDTLSVEERVKEFLSDKDNENLVKSSVNTNSMNTHKSDDTTSTGDYGDYDPTDPSLIQQAEDRRMSVKEWIDILKVRDKKFSKK